MHGEEKYMYIYVLKKMGAFILLTKNIMWLKTFISQTELFSFFFEFFIYLSSW